MEVLGVTSDTISWLLLVEQSLKIGIGTELESARNWNRHGIEIEIGMELKLVSAWN